MVTDLDSHIGDCPQVAITIEGDGLDVERAVVIIVVQPIEPIIQIQACVLRLALQGLCH